ncbi:hypothetical protein V8C86DRAFT_2932509 [Haematococcus lacustris]
MPLASEPPAVLALLMLPALHCLQSLSSMAATPSSAAPLRCWLSRTPHAVSWVVPMLQLTLMLSATGCWLLLKILPSCCAASAWPKMVRVCTKHASMKHGTAQLSPAHSRTKQSDGPAE